MSQNIEQSKTIQNLESAYLLAKQWPIENIFILPNNAEQLGANEVADVFEKTAAQETACLWSLVFSMVVSLFPPETLTVEKMLQLVIDGETYEYTEMYPEFRNAALEERNTAVVAEMDETNRRI